MGTRARRRAATYGIVAGIVTIALLAAPALGWAAPGLGSAGDSGDVVLSGPIADGVTYEHRQHGGPLQVHTVQIYPDAPVEVRPVVAGEQVGSVREPVSSMCARAGAVACVNASYPECPSCGAPHGAIVMNQELVQTPEPGQTQIAIVHGTLRAGWHWAWSAGLLAIGAEERPSISFDAINGRHLADGVVMRTRAWGASTGAPAGSYELVIHAPHKIRTGPGVRQQASFLRVHTEGNAPIPEGGAVITGTGSGADELWAYVETHKSSLVDLVVNTPEGLAMAFSGHPILLADGKPQQLDHADGKVVGRHPRTIIGWNRHKGGVWLVVVDGRSGSSRGMTLHEAADHLRRMGATDAVNLDGGGSSTMVTACPSETGYCVRNRPSDGRERPVWVGLAVVSHPRPVASEAEDGGGDDAPDATPVPLPVDPPSLGAGTPQPSSTSDAAASSSEVIAVDPEPEQIPVVEPDAAPSTGEPDVAPAPADEPAPGPVIASSPDAPTGVEIAAPPASPVSRPGPLHAVAAVAIVAVGFCTERLRRRFARR